jgi:hypothetical protein
MAGGKMRAFNCDRVPWDVSVGHHFMVVEYCDHDWAEIDCVDCGDSVKIPLKEAAEVMHVVCNDPDVQVVFWMRVPGGVLHGKN